MDRRFKSVFVRRKKSKGTAIPSRLVEGELVHDSRSEQPIKSRFSDASCMPYGLQYSDPRSLNNSSSSTARWAAASVHGSSSGQPSQESLLRPVLRAVRIT
jgi:hypothetical protein